MVTTGRRTIERDRTPRARLSHGRRWINEKHDTFPPVLVPSRTEVRACIGGRPRGYDPTVAGEPRRRTAPRGCQQSDRNTFRSLHLAEVLQNELTPKLRWAITESRRAGAAG